MVFCQVRKCRWTFHAFGFQYWKLAWSQHSQTTESCVFWPQLILQLASFSQSASDGMLCHEEPSTAYGFKHQGASFSNVVSDTTWYEDEVSAPHTLKYKPDINEKYVLNELSDLLPVPHCNSAVNLFTDDRAPKLLDNIAVDGFLSPEEKLRGVFLQNLKGKTAVEHALAATGVNVNLDVISGVVNKGNLGGEAMVIFFRWAIKQPSISNNSECYNIITKALGRRKFFGFMMDLLDEMRSNGTISLETLSIILDSFIRARRVKRAIEIFERAEEYGLEYSTRSLNVLVQCLCQRSHIVAASRVLNSVKGKVPANASTYNIIISGWSKLGSICEIKRYLEEMEIEGFSPDCSTFSYLIEGLGRSGQIDEAVSVFEGLKEKDVLVYNALIANFAIVGDFELCMKYYARMLNDKCDPNLDTYTTIISRYLKARKVADALEIFDEMISRGFIPSTSTVTSYIERLCSYGPPYAALMVYKKAMKAGVSISLPAYKLLFTRLSRFGKCGMMLTLWDEMQESGHSSDMEVYEHIINGLCNIGQLENAVLVMEESLQKGFCPGRLIWSKLNNKLMDSNHVGKAYSLFLKIKAARRVENARRYWRSTGWHF